MDVFTGIMAFDEDLDGVAQVLDEEVSCLLPINPEQPPIQQNPTQTPYHTWFVILIVNPASDGELDPDLPWREVHDIPSFQLREAIGNQQPTENDSFPIQNDTSPPDLICNDAMDGLQGE